MSELYLIDIPWETRNLGMPAYQLQGTIKNHKVVESILEKKHTQLVENFFVQLKVNAEKINEVIFAQHAGFRLIEMSISPHLDLNKVNSRIARNSFKTPYSQESSLSKNTENYCCGVEHLQDSIKKAIIDISKKTFNADRFHMDPNCMKSIADKRMGLWVELDLFKNNKNYCTYSIFNNSLVGYVIWNQTDIILNGLSENYKGKGFGKALHIQTILDAMDRGLKEIKTNISVNNLPALNLYSKLDFSFREPKYFLHYWSRI